MMIAHIIRAAAIVCPYLSSVDCRAVSCRVAILVSVFKL